MSKIFDTSSSFSERSELATALSLCLAFGGYGIIAATRSGASFREEGFKILMVISVVGFAGLMALSHTLLAAVTPRQAEQFDERDREFERAGDRWGSFVLACGVFAGLVAVLLEASYFSIANTLLGSWVVSQLVSSVVSITHHRRAH